MSERAYYLGGRFLAVAIRVWRHTLRVEARQRKVLGEPCILAVWHGRLMGVLMDQIASGLVTMASQSSDGALATGAVEGLGMRVARGSTSKGGREALATMGRDLGSGVARAALTVDGPRGPWRQVHPGVVVLARRLRLPVVPATFSCRRAKVLSSWDRMVLPRPFTRMVVAYGEPWPPERLREAGRNAADELATAIDRLTEDLDTELLGSPLWPART